MMNKKILYLTLAVVLIVLGPSMATAIITPPSNMKDPSLSKIWGALIDLQNQITALKNQVANIPAGKQGPAGLSC